MTDAEETPTTDTTNSSSSTDITEEQETKLDALPDGSGTDVAEGDEEQDATSGGAPEEPE
jgi:hypothetical protein